MNEETRIRFTKLPNYTAYSWHPKLIEGHVVCNQCLAAVEPEESYMNGHVEWHNQQKERNVSNVKWCDPGDHAFKAGIEGAQSIQGTQYDGQGNEVVVSQDACPSHAFNKVKAAISTSTTLHCPLCEEQTVVYSVKRGLNTCTECGWNSAK